MADGARLGWRAGARGCGGIPQVTLGGAGVRGVHVGRGPREADRSRARVMRPTGAGAVVRPARLASRHSTPSRAGRVSEPRAWAGVADWSGKGDSHLEKQGCGSPHATREHVLASRRRLVKHYGPDRLGLLATSEPYGPRYALSRMGLTLRHRSYGITGSRGSFRRRSHCRAA